MTKHAAKRQAREVTEGNPSKPLIWDIVTRMVEPGAKVLDLGCGSGDLLSHLAERRGVEATGVEVSEEMVYECVRKGLAVHHGDVDEGLADYPDGCFDYVILNDTLQEVIKPDLVIEEMLRVGRNGIVTFPNFGHWRVRWQVLARGQTPVTPHLPHEWYETPNLHFLSIRDFLRFCRERRIEMAEAHYLAGNRSVRLMPNLMAETALFLVRRG